MPKMTLTYTEAEAASLLAQVVAANRGVPTEKVRIGFDIAAGLPGNDPRERHEAHLASVTVEIAA